MLKNLCSFKLLWINRLKYELDSITDNNKLHLLNAYLISETTGYLIHRSLP